MSAIQQIVRESLERVLEPCAVRPAFQAPPRGRATEFAVRLPGHGALLVAYHPGLAPFQVATVREHLVRHVRGGQRPALCVRKLGWPLLEACRDHDVGVFDRAGNALLCLPNLYIERVRPQRDKEPSPSSGTVFTAKASRIVRAFLARYPHDWTRSELAGRTGLSAGYVSTLTKRLIAQGYVRERGKLLWLDAPDRLLDDWAAHYRFDRHSKRTYALSAATYGEGLRNVHATLESSGTAFAWTGWTGAHLRAPYATPSHYMAYVEAIPAKVVGLHPVEQDGNVTLLLPHDAGVLQFTTDTDVGAIVSDAQLYIDLQRMPGRAKEQAEALRHARLTFAR